MKEQFQQRLEELKAEFASGQKMMNDLQLKQSDLGNTLLRISGAIQVLEELLNQKPGEERIPGNSEGPELQSVASK